MSNEGSAQRKLDKKTNNTLRDNEGTIGNARGAVKANRTLGRALIQSALDEILQDQEELLDECVNCGKLCKFYTCSDQCRAEYESNLK